MLVVKEYSYSKLRPNGGRRSYWLCECDCGNTKVIERGALIRKSNNTLSCGCNRFKKEENHPNYKHGCSRKGKDKDPIYQRWCHIKQRCNDLNDKDYGGRGIRLEEPWYSDYLSFNAWYKEQLNGRPYSSDDEVDRYPNRGGNYSITNCRLVPHSVNMRNRDDNLDLKAFGESLCLAAAVEKYSTNLYSTVQLRIGDGWDVERALITPPLPQVPAGCKKGTLRRPDNYNQPLSDDERSQWLMYISNLTKIGKEHLLESDIKSLLQEHIKNTMSNYSLHYEVAILSGVADSAVFTDTKTICYEIKSDGDYLDRFVNSQKLIFPMAFDECWLLTTSKHLTKATEAVRNTCWGLVDTNFNIIKYPSENDNDENSRLINMMSKVWKQEMIAECRSRGIKGYSNKDSGAIRRLLFNHIPISEIRPLIRKCIDIHRNT